MKNKIEELIKDHEREIEKLNKRLNADNNIDTIMSLIQLHSNIIDELRLLLMYVK